MCDGYFHFAYLHVQYYRWDSRKNIRFCFAEEGYHLQSFLRSITNYGIVWWEGVEEAEGGSQEGMRFVAALVGGIL